jgi:hypothetical protein
VDVGDGLAERECSGELDIDVGGLPGDQIWLEDGGQAEGIVHVEVMTVLGGEDIEVESCHLLDGSRHLTSIAVVSVYMGCINVGPHERAASPPAAADGERARSGPY